MRYKLLGRSGLRVAELCLGTMTFGEEWGWGSNKDESRAVLNAYAEAGGNFIDTADKYTNGTSEKMLGEFLKGEREKWVLATKFTSNNRPDDPNGGGNHRKNIVQACEASLKRLGMDYIDLYWLHAWDGVTPADEVMRALDDLVRAGKVLHIGVSDTPAWIISQANTMADLRGWTPYVGLQIEYSLVERTVERDLIPMAHALDIGVTAWSPLASGLLTGKYKQKTDEPKRLEKAAHFVQQDERKQRIVDAVLEVARQADRSAAQVALNWVRQRHNTIPIIGARKLDQLKDNMACLEWKLSDEQIARLDEVSAVDLGFPHDFLKKPSVRQVMWGNMADTIDNHRSRL